MVTATGRRRDAGRCSTRSCAASGRGRRACSSSRSMLVRTRVGLATPRFSMGVGSVISDRSRVHSRLSEQMKRGVSGGSPASNPPREQMKRRVGGRMWPSTNPREQMKRGVGDCWQVTHRAAEQMKPGVYGRYAGRSCGQRWELIARRDGEKQMKRRVGGVVVDRAGRTEHFDESTSRLTHTRAGTHWVAPARSHDPVTRSSRSWSTHGDGAGDGGGRP